MTTPKRLEEYLQLAQDIAVAVEVLVPRSTALMRAGGIRTTLRDRVLSGLMLKMDSAFRALLDDARAERSEAMHHLKTMAEAFIYFFDVADDPSLKKARFLIADAYDLKATMLRESEHQGPSAVAAAERLRDTFLEGEALPRKRRTVRRIAEEHHLGAWYWRVYSLACEPAHLGDLVEFMPSPDGDVEIGGNRSAAQYRAMTAVHYGIVLALAALHELNRRNELGIEVPLQPFRDRLDNIVRGT